MNRIVVGVDGSATSVVALRAAAREARLRGIGLDVVHAWTYQAAAVLPTSVTMPTPDELDAHGNEIVDKVLADAGLSPTEVVRHVVQGRAGPALVHLSADAALAAHLAAVERFDRTVIPAARTIAATERRDGFPPVARRSGRTEADPADLQRGEAIARIGGQSIHRAARRRAGRGSAERADPRTHV